MAEGAMATFLNSIGEFFTTTLGWQGEILDEITSTPALTVVVFGMAIVGFGYGILRRLINVN